MPLSLDAQITCIERELALRRRVYPRLVAKGTMDQDLATHEIRVMEDVLATLQGLCPQRDFFAPEVPHAPLHP